MKNKHYEIKAGRITRVEQMGYSRGKIGKKIQFFQMWTKKLLFVKLIQREALVSCERVAEI